LILIVLLSLAGSFFGALALSFLALGSFAYFFSPQLVHLDYLEDVVAVVAFLLTSLTVTGLVRRLRARRDELENLLHAMPTLVLNTSLSGLAEFSNQRFRDYTGLSSEELRGRGWMNALHGDDYSVERFCAAVAAGTPFEKEIRIRSATGEYRWFLLRMTPLRNNAKTIVKWCGTATEIEEWKRTEQALLRSEAYLAEAQRLSHTGSWAYDGASRRLLYSSEENFRLFGYEPAAGIPANADWAARIHPEDRQAALETMREKIGDHQGYEIDYRVVRPDGTIRHIRSVAHPVFGASGDVVEVVGTHIDVTERKQAEEARLDAQNKLAHANRVATIGQLTASIAHEVNQPIGALVTNAHAGLRLLKAQPPDLDQVSQALDDIIKDGRRVSDVIDRIRALVKRRPPRREPLDINDVITETVALTRGEMLKNHIALETQLASHLPQVGGDHVQIQQVIMNLVMNAVEAMSTVDEAARWLHLGTAAEPDNSVAVNIRDSGPLLQPECIERFFEAFYSTVQRHGHRTIDLPLDCRSARWNNLGNRQSRSRCDLSRLPANLARSRRMRPSSVRRPIAFWSGPAGCSRPGPLQLEWPLSNNSPQCCSIARDDQFQLQNLLDRGFEHHHLAIERRVRRSTLHRPDRNEENRNDHR
jgi:PAS domain S-box-containing protein